MQIYQHTDYRKFLRETLHARPGRGRGELQKMARFAGIHSSVLSQVFQEKRDLTGEQAVAVAHYLELGEPESLYFLLLTQSARAGTERLRSLYRGELEKIRRAQTQVATRARPSRSLTHEEKAVFYSSWHYSAIRVLSALPHCRTKEALRKKVGLPPEKFRRVVQFLLEHGLLREDEGGYAPGLHWTHLEGDSPLVARHHANWRLKAMERHPAMDTGRELAYTCPVALSREDAELIRARLVDVIDEVTKRAGPSKSETVYFLNVDWLEA